MTSSLFGFFGFGLRFGSVDITSISCVYVFILQTIYRELSKCHFDMGFCDFIHFLYTFTFCFPKTNSKQNITHIVP